ncbi:hypothetical protein KR009_003722, partial [Drosophila setifemur]
LCIIIMYQISSKVEFTNLKCTSLDNKFCEFPYCFIKAINRTYKYISFKAKMYQTPITKVKMNFALFKRFNGFRPFLYNVTIDSCRFLNNTSANPIAKYFYGLIKSSSNMNHTCPYTHDIITEKLTISHLNDQLTRVLPFPEGEYLIDTYWKAYDISRARVEFYFTIS